MESIIAIGFGIAIVTKDGQEVYNELEVERKHVAENGGEECQTWPPFWTGQDAENAALSDPDHEWLIMIHGPMSGATWKRTASNLWECIESNGGFA
jgi:hypothetical protein